MSSKIHRRVGVRTQDVEVHVPARLDAAVDVAVACVGEAEVFALDAEESVADREVDVGELLSSR